MLRWLTDNGTKWIICNLKKNIWPHQSQRTPISSFFSSVFLFVHLSTIYPVVLNWFTKQRSRARVKLEWTKSNSFSERSSQMWYPSTDTSLTWASQPHSTWLFSFKRQLGLWKIRIFPCVSPSCQTAHWALQMASPSLVMMYVSPLISANVVPGD